MSCISFSQSSSISNKTSQSHAQLTQSYCYYHSSFIHYYQDLNFQFMVKGVVTGTCFGALSLIHLGNMWAEYSIAYEHLLILPYKYNGHSEQISPPLRQLV